MTTKVIALTDVGSYKAGASIPVLGKAILIDGDVREIANLNPSIFKVVGEASALPIYNEENDMFANSDDAIQLPLIEIVGGEVKKREYSMIGIDCNKKTGEFRLFGGYKLP